LYRCRLRYWSRAAAYLAEAIDWLLNCHNADGLWDYGTQTKDPSGYFGYFSTNRNYKHNKIVDCTMEALHVFHTYLENTVTP